MAPEYPKPMHMENQPPPCTPATAGQPRAVDVAFQYYRPPMGCILDPVGRAGSCNVGGCTVRNAFRVLEDEASIQAVMQCDASTPSGIDFERQRLLFVRQGMRVGETMGVQPVLWFAETATIALLGERRQSFCTGGQPLTGGIVSYAITYPIPTSSTATVARHICFRRTRCDCTEEECS